MMFLKNLRNSNFWRLFLHFAAPFFIFVTIFSLLINSFSDVFSGNFDKVYQNNFSDGKWKIFFTPKIVLSIIYGLYMANKNFNLKKRP